MRAMRRNFQAPPSGREISWRPSPPLLSVVSHDKIIVKAARAQVICVVGETVVAAVGPY